MEGLTAGRMVHYVMPDGRYQGEHRPAIVIKVWGNSEPHPVQLAVFIDGTNDYPRSQFKDAVDDAQVIPVAWKTSVTFDDEKRPGTWHWIELA